MSKNSDTTPPKIKILWEVSPKPKGAYRSFHRRGWPTGFIKGASNRILLRCEDEYVPSKVRTGDHGPIKILIGVHTEFAGSSLRTLSQRADTLEEAKEIALEIFQRNPSWIDWKTKDTK